MNMSHKPIFLATHPRSCSTAFERVFMTRRESLQCAHEPFGDAYYFGPERLSSRYEGDEQKRIDTGFHNTTYQTVLERLEREGVEGKRLFIKDMAQYLFPPDEKPASIAPSLSRLKRGVGTTESFTNGSSNGTTAPPYPYHTDSEPNNPTVIPRAILENFHFTFLIRHPRSSIPSYYRCTVPPLDEVTGFYDYMPSEAGYDEVRRLFDYLCSINQIGPHFAGREIESTETNGNATINGGSSQIEICVIDADDLLDNPSGIVEAYCRSVGIDYHPDMLKWDSKEANDYAKEVFAKWKGFHEDVLNSTELKERLHKKKIKSDQDQDSEWREKYGEKGAKVIRDSVNASITDYEYLKQFALSV